jgi:methionyl-tRNA formyltransferase
MDENADTGDIVSQVSIDIDYDDDAASLSNKIMDVAVEQLSTLIYEFETGSVKRIPQTEVGNTWRKRGRADGQIDWRMSSMGIYNLVRALTKPYVGTHFVYNDTDIRVWKVREIEEVERKYANIEPSKVIKVVSDNQFIVKAGDNLIEVLDCDAIRLKEGILIGMADLKKQVVVVSPHPEDETLGAGGTLVRLIKEGYQVYWINVSTGKGNPNKVYCIARKVL